MKRLLLSVLFIAVCAVAQVGPAPAVRSDMLVSTEWLAQHATDANIVVLHVGRDRAGYDAGHIPGARFLPLSAIAVSVNGSENELPPAADLVSAFAALGIGDRTRVVIYGDIQNLLAARAWFTLDYLGHGDSAALLDGGLEKWNAEKRPISNQATAAAKTATFSARIQPQAIVHMDTVRDISYEINNVKAPNFALIDARPEAEFTGATAGQNITRPGHIPGAVSVYWQQNIESAQNPVLRPATQLRRLYADAGVTPSRIAVAYCRTGVQASHSYFTLKYLGYDVLLYDGSYLEWSSNRANPTEVRK